LLPQLEQRRNPALETREYLEGRLGPLSKSFLNKKEAPASRNRLLRQADPDVLHSDSTAGAGTKVAVDMGVTGVRHDI
jgi:hypothetical protein